MNETLASEIYKDLKDTIRFLKVLVVILVAVIATMAIYHDYQWSQFDTVVVDSEKGPANYVGGENSGGIFNGTGSSSQEEEDEQVKFQRHFGEEEDGAAEGGIE